MMFGIHAITRDDGIAIVYIQNPPDVPGLAYLVFGTLADAGVDVDIILQTNRGGDVIFTVHKEDMEHARDVLEEQFRDFPGTSVEIDPCAVKLSVSGEGMQGKPGVAAKVFKCLWDAGVKIVNISTSEVKICMLIPMRDADAAYAALVNGFEMD